MWQCDRQPLAHGNQAGNGSRQYRSVTLGKGWALRAGYRVLRCGLRAEQELLNTLRWIVDHGEMRFARQRMQSDEIQSSAGKRQE